MYKIKTHDINYKLIVHLQIQHTENKFENYAIQTQIYNCAYHRL